jgi:type II restriction/modification system DNA methylase subunit YeeA
MTKETLVAQLEGAKTLSSQVDIDKVIELLNQLVPEQVVRTEFKMTPEAFESFIDKVNDAVDGLRTDRVVDRDSASFGISYNNQVELEEVELDIDYIQNSIREDLESSIEIIEDEAEEEDEDEADELHQQILSGDEAAQMP